DTPLRRLTKYDRIELEAEKERLTAEIGELTRILESDAELRKLVSAELAAVAKKFGDDRRTLLLESAATPSASVPLQVADDPCPPRAGATRVRHGVIVWAVPAAARGEVGVVTSAGRLLRLDVVALPPLPGDMATPHLSGGAPLAEFVSLADDEEVLCLTTLDE